MRINAIYSKTKADMDEIEKKTIDESMKWSTVYPRFYPLPILSKFDFIHFSFLEILNKKLLKVRKM